MALTTISALGRYPDRPVGADSRPERVAAAYRRLAEIACGMFSPGELGRLVPRSRPHDSGHENGDGPGPERDPLSATEAIAYKFLAKGGKHSRPFITLATYHALTHSDDEAVPGGGGNGQPSAEVDDAFTFSDSIKRTAMSIEIFHKASLVHDDIEDDDPYRYGDKTLHRRYGTATAINVGDYLVGMGYRLLSGEAAPLGAETVADILGRMADAHVKLTEGQGAELLWRDSLNKRLTTQDAIRIYELKTAPAFEAAIYSGLRLAGRAAEYTAAVHTYARNLGVAFQILNDLGDWIGDDHNKLAAGGDVLGGRPTVLWALALEALSAEEREELVAAAAATAEGNGDSLERVRRLYDKAGVFEQAARLVHDHRREAIRVSQEVDSPPLQQLLLYLVEKVLARPESAVK
jgi:geranylgeranyl pyrophosphate synthase